MATGSSKEDLKDELAGIQPEEEDEDEKDTQKLNIPDNSNATYGERFAVLAFVLIPWCCVMVSFVLIRTTGWLLYVFLAYVAYMFLIQNFQHTGGFPQGWLRGCFFFRWFKNYFPVHVIKTTDLDPTKNYLFGYHPHGIIGMGAFATFATDATEFPKLFPGIRTRLLTLDVNFRIPFYSFYLGALGVCSAGKRSCMHILSKLKGGDSIVLVLGGAKESLDAHPGTFDLTLKQRKGFVKIALRTGATLVPCFGFGENEIYRQVDNPVGSKLRKWQNYLQKILGFAIPLIMGRGIWTDFGLLPLNKRIKVVIGKPIPVPKTPEGEITLDLLNKYHEMYLQGLIDIYEDNKNIYAFHRKKSLTFVR
mmetsp:Transcript_24600/g.36877  ORF Transcript_24600/g.36877 Transcript_24600/m.36877 type:complete len:363 (-) Transcript_24600:162-1250(-)